MFVYSLRFRVISHFSISAFTFFNQDQWDREKEIRSKGKLDGQYVLGLLDDIPSDEELTSACLKGKAICNDTVDLKEYQHCIIMPAADRSLDAIY